MSKKLRPWNNVLSGTVAASDTYYEDIQKHKEECEADFKEQQSEERWYANSLGDDNEL